MGKEIKNLLLPYYFRFKESEWLQRNYEYFGFNFLK